MSVSIFGSSSSKTNITKNYVDSKFITLIKNINTKLDRGGDSMKGNLDMGNSKINNLYDPEEETDAVNKKYVDKLTSSVDPNVATKNYVDEKEKMMRTYIDDRDHKYVKNSVGFIPDLARNTNKYGFIVSATGTIPPVKTDGKTISYEPYVIFNSSKLGDWVVHSSPPLLERWVKIRCPESVKIHKFTIRGREGDKIGNITEWKFQGSVNDNEWVDLYTCNMQEITKTIDQEFKTFQISPSADKYLYYRFIILRMTGENVGLNHLQIYSADPIM